MGNVPTTVKHCLSYEQLIQDYPWLKRWLLEEKVGVVFLVSQLLHMLCHMTERMHSGQPQMTPLICGSACCLCNVLFNLHFALRLHIV